MKITTLSLLTLLLVSTQYYAASYSVQPKIIQGGMGVRISGWKLAREVARKGQLGVISGTAMDTVFVRILQDGDPDGTFRRALSTFPNQDMVQRAMDKYFIPGGKDPSQPYKSIPMLTATPSQLNLELLVLGNYCEVWLAKHNDDGSVVEGLVGINRLMKVQLPTIACLYGAMLADVDYVLMGAGIPLKIPGVLDNLAKGQDCSLLLDVDNAGDEEFQMEFSPLDFWTKSGKPELAKPVKRPAFLPIVSSVVLAQTMLKRANGEGPNKGIDGFVVELSTAGGHNAPPRGFRYDPVSKTHDADLNERGEPVYGKKDDVDLLKFLKASKGLPFWLAGSYGRADKFCDVLEMGGAGVQVGTLFALCDESGMRDETRQLILGRIAEKDLQVLTDPVASPTGYPFKVLEFDNTLSDEQIYKDRPRVCNLGYLRTPYIQPNGKMGYRCPAEPIDQYLKKGGSIEATVGRKCLCNALMADAGFPQIRTVKDENGEKKDYLEDILVTMGDDVNKARRYMKFDEQTGRWSYTAADVVDHLLKEWNKHEAQHEINQKVFAEQEMKHPITKHPITVGASDGDALDPNLGV